MEREEVRYICRAHLEQQTTIADHNVRAKWERWVGVGTHEWALNVSLPSTPLSLYSAPSPLMLGECMNDARPNEAASADSTPSFERTRLPGMAGSGLSSLRPDRPDRLLKVRDWRVFCSADERASESSTSTPCSAPCPRPCSMSAPSNSTPTSAVKTVTSFETRLARGPFDGVVLIAGWRLGVEARLRSARVTFGSKRSKV